MFQEKNNGMYGKTYTCSEEKKKKISEAVSKYCSTEEGKEERKSRAARIANIKKQKGTSTPKGNNYNQEFDSKLTTMTEADLELFISSKKYSDRYATKIRTRRAEAIKLRLMKEREFEDYVLTHKKSHRGRIRKRYEALRTITV